MIQKTSHPRERRGGPNPYRSPFISRPHFDCISPAALPLSNHHAHSLRAELPTCSSPTPSCARLGRRRPRNRRDHRRDPPPPLGPVVPPRARSRPPPRVRRRPPRPDRELARSDQGGAGVQGVERAVALYGVGGRSSARGVCVAGRAGAGRRSRRRDRAGLE